MLFIGSFILNHDSKELPSSISIAGNNFQQRIIHSYEHIEKLSIVNLKHEQ